MSHLNANVKWDGEDFLCILNDDELPQITKAYGWGKSVYAAINGFWASLEAAYNEIENKGYGSYNYPKYVMFTYDDSSMYMLYAELVKFGGMPKVSSITVEQSMKYANGKVTPRPDTLDKIRVAISQASAEAVKMARESQLAKDYHYKYEINWSQFNQQQNTQQLTSSQSATQPTPSSPSAPTSFASGNRKGGDTFVFDGKVPYIQMFNESCACLNLYLIPVAAAKNMNESLMKSVVQLQREEGIESDFTEAKLSTSASIKDALDQLANTFYMNFFVMTRDSSGSLVEIEDYSLPLNHLVAPKTPKASIASKLASRLSSQLPTGLTSELESQLTSKLADYVGEDVANGVVNKGKGLLKSLFGKKK